MVFLDRHRYYARLSHLMAYKSITIWTQEEQREISEIKKGDPDT